MNKKRKLLIFITLIFIIFLTLFVYLRKGLIKNNLIVIGEIGKGFRKNGNKIYYWYSEGDSNPGKGEWSEVPDADYGTFEIVDGSHPIVAKDKNHVWYSLPFMADALFTIEGLSGDSFKDLGCYLKDNDSVHYDVGPPIKEADVGSFEEINTENHLCFGKDKNYVYFRGLKIQGINPELFDAKKFASFSSYILYGDDIFYIYNNGEIKKVDGLVIEGRKILKNEKMGFEIKYPFEYFRDSDIEKAESEFALEEVLLKSIYHCSIRITKINSTPESMRTAKLFLNESKVFQDEEKSLIIGLKIDENDYFLTDNEKSLRTKLCSLLFNDVVSSFKLIPKID